jgi:hypothetical protein
MKPYLNREKRGVQVRMFIVVLLGYMWFSESKTNLISAHDKCKPFEKNIFIKKQIHH